MLIAAFIAFSTALLAIAWFDDFCPQCRKHALAPADVGLRCERCGWFRR